MNATQMRRTAMPFIALLAAGGIAAAFGIQLAHREWRSAIGPGAASPVSTSISTARDQHPVESGSPRPQMQSGNGVPTFDIARIEPSGEAVIAGRAAPGATVELLANGKVLGSVTADQAGEFVIVPPRLPSGRYNLTLRAKRPDGKQLESQQSVAVALEPAPNPHAVAQLTPNNLAAAPSQPAASQRGTVVLQTLAVAPGGKLHLEGRARPGATIKVYLNDNLIASVTAGADRHFTVTINEGLRPGSYRVRLDEVAENSGAVLARAETPFNVAAAMAASSASAATDAIARDDSPAQAGTRRIATAEFPSEGGSPSNVVVPSIVTTAVARGDSLWRISRDTYGAGERYRVIFGANRRQIHNPDLIYPGQILVLPRR